MSTRNGTGPPVEAGASHGERHGAQVRAAGACWAVLLAAGEGRRFGGRKLLALLDGRPLVEHALAAIDLARMQGTLAGGVAVVSAGEPDLRALAERRDLLTVENPEPEAGLSRSLRLGLAALERKDLAPRPEAAVIVLGDQPLVRAGVISSLVAARTAEGAPCIRPRYAAAPDSPGHPVLVERALWQRLAGDLEGDVGLGPVLARHPEWVSLVDVSGANPDVDARADLEDLEGRF
jgi:CTP:molybdopterin cytidylyltransferase MocA